MNDNYKMFETYMRYQSLYKLVPYDKIFSGVANAPHLKRFKRKYNLKHNNFMKNPDS